MSVAARNNLGTLVAMATASGLTGLDQAVAPFTGGLWVRQYAPLVTDYLWSHTDSAGAPRNGVAMFAQSRGRAGLTHYDASSGGVTSPDGFFRQGQWVHFGARCDGTTGFLYRNGVLVYSAAMTKVPAVTGTRTTRVGGNPGTVGSEVEVWDIRIFPGVSLSHAEMGLLPIPTSVLPHCKQRLFYQHNFRSQGAGAVTVFDESGNGNHLTTSSTTAECDAHPRPNWRRILFGRKVFYRTPATGAVLEGALTSSSTLTGALTVQKQLAGALTPSSAITGAIGVTKPLAGALTSVSSITAALLGQVSLAGSFSGLSVLVGTLYEAAGPLLFMKVEQAAETTAALLATAYGAHASIGNAADTTMDVSAIETFTGY